MQQDNSWNDRYDELDVYKAEHGNCLVPQRYSKNEALGTWVATQRAQYRLRREGKHSHLTEERIKLLNEVGFEWSPQDNSWNDRYDELDVYEAEHGNCLVPTVYPENKALGTWVATQRAQYRLRREGKHSHLTEERIKLLEDLGFEWSPQDNSWNDLHRLLVEYEAEHGNCLVPQHYPDNKALGTWVDTQRTQYRLRREGKHSHLTEERIKLLEDLGFVWSHHGNSWNDRYNQLVEYKNEHGNCLVPQRYPDNKALGKWVAKQRTQYRLRREGKQTPLTEERIKLLDEVGFVWSVKK